MRALALLMMVAGCHAAKQHPGDGDVPAAGDDGAVLDDGRDLAGRDLAGYDFAGVDLASSDGAARSDGGARPDLALPVVGTARTLLFYAAQNFKTGGYPP